MDDRGGEGKIFVATREAAPIQLAPTSIGSSVIKAPPKRSVYSLAIVVILIITFVSVVIFTYFKNRTGNIKSIVDNAVERSAYSPTVFLIYDKSTTQTCNRLIQVMPFDWYVWAIQGELYVLNAEGIYSCPANNTPAIRIFEDQFVETCLGINYDNLLNSYKLLPAKSVAYDISTTTFTIFSALNILATKYITFTGIAQNAFVRLKHDGQDDGKRFLYDKLYHKKHVLLEKEHVIRKSATHKHNIAIADLTRLVHVHHSRLHEQTRSPTTFPVSFPDSSTDRSVVAV